MTSEELNASTVLLEKTKEANDLYSLCEQLPDIVGKGRLQRKIKAELGFLIKLASRSPNININHLKSSNLSNLSAIVESIFRHDGVVQLLMPFTYIEDDSSRRIVVDIVADYGRTWVKVVARNPDALLQVSRGAGKFGRKSLIERIKELKNCAIQNEHLFLPPKVEVCFPGNIDEELFSPLIEMGVEVLYLSDNQCFYKNEGSSDFKNQSHTSTKSVHVRVPREMSGSSGDETLVRIPDASHFAYSACKIKDVDLRSDLALSAIAADATLNLDVSCMIAFVSNLTNGYCNAKLKDKILIEQGEREAVSSVRSCLDTLFQGRKLVCCNLGYRRFIDIFTLIGGKQEKKRAANLLSRVAIVADAPSLRCMQLQENGKVNDKSKIIFGTGDTLKAVTVTANAGFIRAAKCQGEKFVAFLHESRALSEMKELPDS